MKHTRLTVRNYVGFTTTIFLISSVSVGFGAVDLVMIAPKGTEYVAAVGLGEVITAGIFALLVIGLVDIFSSRLAIEEGRGGVARRLSVLAGALLVLIVPVQVIAFLLALGVEPGLRLVGQDASVIPLTGDFVTVRALSIGFAIVFAALNEALKICGLKNRALMLLIVGFGANAALDWLFLYTGAAVLFSSPASAVAAATTVTQALIACGSLWSFLSSLRERSEPLARMSWAEIAPEARSMARVAPGVGLRHFNDDAGTLAITLILGTLGVQVLAAVTVATKIWSLFCRIPQACVSGTFVFYGYQLGQDPRRTAQRARTLLWYSVVPTAVGAAAVALSSPWLVRLFAGADQDTALTQLLLLAFLCTLPAYLIEHHFGEILTAHQRSGLLALGSTITTYTLSVPLAAIAAFVFGSPFLVIASALVPSAVLAWIFGRSLRRDHWNESGVKDASGAGLSA